MSAERQRKIELLARKDLARREHPYYLTELSHILKVHLTERELFDLETTDKLFSQSKNACGQSQLALTRTWPLYPSSAWTRVCFCMAQKLRAEPVALFVGPYNLCGAVRTRAEYPLFSAISLLEFDNDTLTMQSLSSDGGLYLDLYEENSTRSVEMKAWGSWRQLAESCLGIVKK